MSPQFGTHEMGSPSGAHELTPEF